MPIISAFPGFCLLLELGVSFDVINYICLSFMRIHADIYFNYISYFGLLIFCCQNVAISSYMFQNSILRYFEYTASFLERR